MSRQSSQRVLGLGLGPARWYLESQGFASFLTPILTRQRLCQVLKPAISSLRPVGITQQAYVDGKAFELTRPTRPTANTPSLPERSVIVFHPPPRSPSQSESASVPKTKTWFTKSFMAYIDILTTPTADTPGAALYVHFDNKRYIFGRLAEGLQRTFNQRRVPLAQTDQIFLSGEVNWATVGGMMGLLITVADVILDAKTSLAENNAERRERGRKLIVKDFLERLNIHGPENLTYTMATARNFIFRTGMPFRTHELLEDRRMVDPLNLEPDFKDDNLNVWKVPLVQRSRKRKLEDEAAQEVEMEADNTSKEKKPQAEDKQYLAKVVNDMFNSSWSMDTLIPTKLQDVKLPATIFVRVDGHVQKYQGPLPGQSDCVPDMEVLVREPWPSATIHSLPQTSYSSQSLCYVAKLHSRRGKFNAPLALELGVRKQDNSRLVKGDTVPGKDGKMVTPDMVIAPSVKGEGFAVMDIPDPSYLDSFFARPEWTNEEIMDSVHVMYWILGEGVVTNPHIQAFMRNRPSVQHILLSPDTCPNMISIESAAGLHAKLGRIDPDRFPELQFRNTVPDLGIPDRPYIMGRVGRRTKISPLLIHEDNNVVPFFSPAQAVSNISKPGIFRAAEKAAARAVDPDFLAKIEKDEEDMPNRDTEIIALGTGSALPSKYRNVSSTLVKIPGVGNYLFDCGENTLGQMRRALGYEGAARTVKDLRCIVISHMHADHHLGTVGVIKAWQKEADSEATLAISCTYFMRRFLEEYSQVEHLDVSRLRFYGDETSYGDKPSDVDYNHTFPENDPSGLAEIGRVRVNHCKSAHAVVLSWPSGLKIAFSGDCRPSEAFARRGRGAHLLIHEATFGDDMAPDAQAKKHSTVAEALWVADQMRARRVLLTHFSQRYAKGSCEVEEAEMGREHRVVLSAFDLMRVKLGEFRVAELFLPAIRRLMEAENEGHT